MNILVRMDSSASIGRGHLFRCLCIADFFKLQGHQVAFLINNNPDNDQNFLQSKGYEVFCYDSSPLEVDQDIQKLAQCLEDRKFDCLLLDHYQLDRAWEQKVREIIPVVFVIDDLGRPHDCDFLLDATLGRMESFYSESNVRKDLFLGSQCAILRPEFLKTRSRAFARRQALGKIKNIFINLGGGEVSAITEKALRALSLHPAAGGFDVVVLVNSSSEKNLAKLGQSFHSCQILGFSEQISQLFLDADLAIGASGISSYERACLGLPSLMLQVAENQSENHLVFDQQKLAFGLGDPGHETFEHNLQKALDLLLNDFEAYLEMVSQCFKRVSPVGLIDQLDRNFGGGLMALRPADPADRDVVFDWQSFPGARAHSRNKSAPTYEEHTQWFRSSLESQARSLFILEISSIPVGFLKVDFGEKNEVSILIAHGFHGNGLAQRALHLLRPQFPDLDLHAYIEAENQASVRVFTQCGYVSQGEGWYLNSKKAMLSK